MTDFSRMVRLDEIRDGMRVDLSARQAECDAIAARLDLRSIDRLEAHVTLTRDGERVHAEGRLRASVEQSCVVTGDPVAAAIDEPFSLDFLPEPTAAADEEVELGEDDCDVVFHDGATIDLGAAVADTLALSIDPYPRSAGAETALKKAGVMNELEAGPFGALAALKGKLENDS